MIGSRSSSMRSCGGSLVGLSTLIDGSVGEQHLVDDRRRAGDQVQIVFALEPLLHDVHVQQPEESAAKAEAERGRHLGLEMQRRVVELELLEGVAELLVVVRAHREQAREHARLDLLEARAAAPCAGLASSVIVSPTGAPSISLMPAITKPTSPVFRASRVHRLRREPAERVDDVAAPGRHHADFRARPAAHRS